MAIPDREYSFTYRDLANATGLTRNAISQHVSRGKLDPDDLESIAVYLSRYAREDLRKKMILSAIERQRPDDPGGWKKKRRKPSAS